MRDGVEQRIKWEESQVQGQARFKGRQSRWKADWIHRERLTGKSLLLNCVKNEVSEVDQGLNLLGNAKKGSNEKYDKCFG